MTLTEFIEIYNKELNKIFASPNSWKKLLEKMSYLTKFNFASFVVVSYQVPDLRYCEKYDKWNEMGRYIKKDSKAISAYNKAADKIYSVYDIRDTVQIRNRGPVEWEISEETSELVKSMLNDEFCNGKSTDNLYRDVAEAFFDRNIDYLYSFKDYKSFIISSVGYVVAVRCHDKLAIEMNNYDFNLPDNHNLLKCGDVGNIVINASRHIIRRIEQKIKEYNREKSIQKSLAVNTDKRYNNDTRINSGTGEIDDDKRRKKNGNERKNESEIVAGDGDTRNRVHEDRGLLLSEYSDARASTADEIWIDPKGLSSGVQTAASGHDGWSQHIHTTSAVSAGTGGRDAQDSYGTESERGGEERRVDTKSEERELGGVGNDNDETGDRDADGGLQRTDIHLRQTISSGIDNKAESQEADAILASASLRNEKEKTLPTITCEWSESNVFEDGRTYSVYEFDTIMKQADKEHFEGHLKNFNKYGSYDTWQEEDEESYYRYIGYYKTKFIVNMPDGTSFSERQDIGDGDGGVIDFLDRIPSYRKYMPTLKEAYEIGKNQTTRGSDYEQLSLFDVIPSAGEQAEAILISSTEPYVKTLIETIPIATPEINMVTGHNYHIGDITESKGRGFAPRTKFRDNVDAIKIMRRLDMEKRQASTDEQQILAKYAGWGGLSSAFDKGNSDWASEYQELKSLLNETEYVNARESTLTAFYTPPLVINAIYKALDKFGFQAGSILEPSCGIGNFFGCLPLHMSNSVQLTGVELDGISAKIAAYLYPEAKIIESAYETAPLKNNYYDVAIGNVPFGEFKVFDSEERDWNYSIHNYFFAKTLKRIHDGGIIAFVTSSYMLDGKNFAFRKYLAQNAEFIGAVRLPNTTFASTAGTFVTADIVFLKKREYPIVNTDNEEFVHLGEYKGHGLNQYFINHPEMVCGELVEVSGQYGPILTCRARRDETLEYALKNAILRLPDVKFEKTKNKTGIEQRTTQPDELIPASSEIDDMTYGIVNNAIYFRKGYNMELVEGLSKKEDAAIRELIILRQIQKKLIAAQLNTLDDTVCAGIREELNEVYDNYVKKYGYINNRFTLKLFQDDRYVYLLTALENSYDEGKTYNKADIFYKRTVKPNMEITSCKTAKDALIVSLNYKGVVDIEYISRLCNMSEDKCIEQLRGAIYKLPETGEYVTADEYLSGNIKDKLVLARTVAENDPFYAINVRALEKSLPERICAADIKLRIGATWIPVSVYEKFMYEFLEVPIYMRSKIKIVYIKSSGEYNIVGKKYDKTRTIITQTYGTEYRSAYEIYQDTLNLKDVKITKEVEDEEGRITRVVDRKATIQAQSRQDVIKERFLEWVWENPNQRKELEDIYNDKFNSVRNREYDGSFLELPGSNPNIKLNPHQLNAIARIVFGGNTLLAHVVGAGKTFEMVAAAMEEKRLGLCNKPLFVVPNHLTLQTASEFMTLYPTANLLVSTPKDFKPENRKKFCSKIAMGEYDAVIIGHSQFEKIPLSPERQKMELNNQVQSIIDEIESIRNTNSYGLDAIARVTVKRLEKTKRSLEARLKSLNDTKKDDVVTFEELGVDRLFVDEAHYYKNLYIYTKMSNISGISTTESKKSLDMYMKCSYLNEITNEHGVIFATGTPISNSMTEMYTMQRYLKPSSLKSSGLMLFDEWASTFGDTVTAMELAPEGQGYRMKTRFSRFYNVPELVNMFKEFADVQTADMLNLEVPKAEYHAVSVKASEYQREILNKLAERADAVRKGTVNPCDDNMLKITTDGRNLALDQRIYDSDIEEGEQSKVKCLIDNAIRLYNEYAEDNALQLIFCDISTPKIKTKTGKSDERQAFTSIYDDIKAKLMFEGVSESEIAYIHDAETDVKKDALFQKCREGEVRFLLGSTSKLGAGTNIQNRLIALHHLDVPWRPSDIEQREGRIIRRGNKYDTIHIFRYVTEGTFDAYSWQIIENKQKFIGQVMTSKVPVRVADDIDEAALSYAEIKALASGNPYIKERMELESKVSKLKMLEAAYKALRLSLSDKIKFKLPNEISYKKTLVENLKMDMKLVKATFANEGFPGITIGNREYREDINAAGEILIAICRNNKNSDSGTEVKIGSYRGFSLYSLFDPFMVGNGGEELPYRLILKGNEKYYTDLGRSPHGNFQRLDNVLKKIESNISDNELKIEELKADLKCAEEEIKKPFKYADELKTKTARLNELTRMLDMDGILPQQDIVEETDDISKGNITQKYL